MAPLFGFAQDSFLPYPILPVGSDSERIDADGLRYFSVAQAALKSGISERELSELWENTVRQFASVDSLAREEGAIAQRRDARERIIRERLCGALNDQQYAEVRLQADAMGIDLACRSVWVTTTTDEETGEEHGVLVAKLEFLQERVLASGLFDGRDPIEYRSMNGDWSDRWDQLSEPPYECRVTFYRRGIERGYSATGLWIEMMRDTKFWRGKQCFMLAKSTMAKGLRELFRDILGNIYIPEELPSPRRKFTGPKLVEHEGAGASDEEGIATESSARQRMRRIGAAQTSLQDKIIQSVKRESGMDDIKDGAAFWEAVVDAANRMFRGNWRRRIP